MNTPSSSQEQNTLFGHPAGLYTLFFAEMWERFSYYGMRALLILYMIKGFLGYNDSQANSIYGAYTALVYMTPFFGGMIADRLLGQRKAVVLGGALMAAGHLFMRFENETVFFIALALLILGNGFFKPNISTIVGSLYPEGSAKRDSGFTLFYIGINLGAAMAPLLCGYIGETYGWHHGFGLATYGMLIGLAVFVLPTILTQALIMLGALTAAGGLLYFHADDAASTFINYAVAGALLVAGTIATIALQRGGLPKDAGLPPDPEKLRKPTKVGLPANWLVYLGTLALVPVFTFLVWGFAPFNSTTEERSLTNKDIGEEIDIAPEDRERIARDFLFDGVELPDEKRRALQDQLLGLDKIKINEGLVNFKFNEEKKEPLRVIPEATLYRMAKVIEDRKVTKDDVGKRLNIKARENMVGGSLGEEDFTEEKIIKLVGEDKFYSSDSTVPLAVSEDYIGKDISEEKDSGMFMRILSTFLKEMSSPAGLVLTLAGIGALIFILRQMRSLGKIARERLYVVLIMTFFSLLFWAIFEQAGSSVNLFTDRNVDRVSNQTRPVTAADIGEELEFELTQKQLGYEIPWALTGETEKPEKIFRFKQGAGETAPAEEKKSAALFTISRLDNWRKKEKERKITSDDIEKTIKVNTGKLMVAMLKKNGAGEKNPALRKTMLDALGTDKVTELVVTKDFVGLEISEVKKPGKVKVRINESHEGMFIAEAKDETKASTYQSLNPAYILVLGLLFTALWGFLGARGLEPSTPVKFAFGLAQLGLGLGCFWMGAAQANDIGMVAVLYLYVGYLLQTTGELCLSPVGLSMVTKLSPTRLVSTVMGMWFLATAFSAFLSGIIAQFTSVGHGSGGGGAIPAPSETVDLYGGVFGILAVTGLVSGAICLALSPFLKRWMHEGVEDEDGGDDGEGAAKEELPEANSEEPPAVEGSEA